MEYKTCTKCKIHKPFSDYHKASHRKDGHQVKCKECKALIAREDRLANPEKFKIRTKEQKTKHADKIKAYRENNMERERERHRAWTERNRESVREKARANYHRHSERYKADGRAYRKANPEKGRFSLAKRRAQMKTATVAWSDSFKMKTIYSKADRLGKWLDSKYDVDHIVPLQSDFVCGLHNEFNLQILPKLENISKGNRYWPDMWEQLKE